MKEERRFLPLELRVDSGDDKPPHIIGHAAVFNKLSEDLGGFREKIASGAFAKTIEKDDIRALFNHDSNYVLGRTKSGTLTLAEDERGLAFDNDPPDTQWAKDLMVSIRRKDITQMSFGFNTIKDEWEYNEGKQNIRTLLEVQLFDISPVTFPAYPQTDVKVRSILAGVGIDYDALTNVITRAQHGLQLQPADRDLLNASIGILRGLLPIEPDGAEGSMGIGGAEQARRLLLYRRHLELAEKAI